MTIELHLHFHGPITVDLLPLTGVLNAINELKEIIMTGQAEAAAQLNTVGDKLDKIATESQGLLDEIAALKVLVEQQGGVSADLQAAIDRVAGKADTIDGLVQDAPPATP